MWWYLLLILPALIVILLLMPIYVSVKLDNTTPQFKVKLGFINITRFVIKDDDSKDKPKRSAKKQKNEKRHNSNKKKKLSLTEKIAVFKETVSMVWNAAKTVAKRITVTRFSVNCRVSSEDAAQTAILYGAACAGMSALEAFVNENFKVKRQNIYIYPDFTQSKAQIYADLRIRIFVFSVIAAGISIMFNIIKRKAD